MTFLYKTLATSFGAGYAPIAPGTAGALVGAVAFWGMAQWGFSPDWPLIVASFIVFFIGVFVTNQLEPEWGKDPSRIVIDEVLGMWITMFLVPLTPLNLFIGFILFRVFDIWKPLFIRRLEALPGGWGVMLDDLLAGIYACIVLHLILHWL